MILTIVVIGFLTPIILNKAWDNYKEIGGKSPLHELTDLLEWENSMIKNKIELNFKGNENW